MSAPADRLLSVLNPKVIERFELKARPMRTGEVPAQYREGLGGQILSVATGGSGQIYRHQALALAATEAGQHVVISTGTASGKSLCFMLPALLAASAGKRTIVFYPTKALAFDQLTRWRALAEAAGLSVGMVGEINGDTAMIARQQALEHCPIILATPDAFHAWFMPMVATPHAQDFLRGLALVVIDEAHSYEGFFGSQSAYFFRRLRAARLRCTSAAEPRFIAATATLRDAASTLRQLVGVDFQVVAEADNGAPLHGSTLLHIDGPERGTPAEQTLAECIGRLAEALPPGESLISFTDSRQGVERVISRVKREDVRPYRAGYNKVEQTAILEGLRDGSVRCVGATSALELGIDIPQFAFGLNQGVPRTRKALRQRAGRVGRSCPGVFAVIAPAVSFARLGSSLRDTMTGEVEPSPLYRENRYIQFQQAMCYLRESGEVDGPAELDEVLDWPTGFDRMLDVARPGGQRNSRMLDDLASLGAANPHLAFALRSIPGAKFSLKNTRNGQEIGTIDQAKALREAYPGASYIHCGQPYRVVDMRTSSFENVIRLEPIKRADRTHPILHCQVGVAMGTDEVIERRHLTSPAGQLVETQMRVLEAVDGYALGSTRIYYRDLFETNPRMFRRKMQFETTGIMIRISEPWFAGASDGKVAVRRRIADALVDVVSRELSIAPGDIHCAYTNVALHDESGATKIDDAIALYDVFPGGLRLLASLFDDFANFLSRLDRGAQLAGDEALLDEETVRRLKSWHCSLQPAAPTTASNDLADDCLTIYAPGSIVSTLFRGQMIERKLLQPQLLDAGFGEQLMYRYETDMGVTAFVAHVQIEPTGNDWSLARWRPITGEISKL